MPDADHRPPDHAAFLSLLPGVSAAARRHVRHVPCPDRREDLVAEAVALAWKWFLGLRARGRDPLAFPATFALLAARAAHSGRRVAGGDRTGDPLSPLCRRRTGLVVSSLPDPGPGTEEFEAALADNTRTPVPDQVQFRLDFPAWLATLPAGKREVLGLLAVGHGTGEVAAETGLSPARISQLRRELHDGYAAFCGDTM